MISYKKQKKRCFPKKTALCIKSINFLKNIFFYKFIKMCIKK